MSQPRYHCHHGYHATQAEAARCSQQVVRCAWCGFLTTQPAVVRLNFGRQESVCPKCYAHDDGDR